MEQFQKENEKWNRNVKWYAIGLFLTIILLSAYSGCVKAEECVYDYKIQYTKAQVEQFKKYSDKYANQYGITRKLLRGIFSVESAWQGGNSEACARGIGQIKRDTVKVFCGGCYRSDGDITAALDNPISNIELTAVHFWWLKRKLNTEDETLLIAAYYAGWGISKYKQEDYSGQIVDYILKVKKAMKDYEDSLPIVEPLNTVKLERVK